jgi:hypothetical protein
MGDNQVIKRNVVIATRQPVTIVVKRIVVRINGFGHVTTGKIIGRHSIGEHTDTSLAIPRKQISFSNNASVGIYRECSIPNKLKTITPTAYDLII